MRPALCTLFLMFAASSASVQAAQEIDVGGGFRRSELRNAVDAHRAARIAQVQREDAMAGRHLTAAERLELREQLRRQWAESSTSNTLRSAESQPPERIVPASAPMAMPIADAQPARLSAGTARDQRP
ncbi:hypothetical protein WKW80_13095 [Variovorax humicola]|uniref:DUF4148 domain-containing protein n=1 Tax=Variovorax humicola TaxID=1769758 RepID=A0ABU8VYQ3_9BURK